MRQLERLATALATVPDLEATRAAWEVALGNLFPAVADLLSPTPDTADHWPCGLTAGGRPCVRRVVEQRQGNFEAVCDEEADCGVAHLRQADLFKHRLGILKLSGRLAAALELAPVAGRSGPFALRAALSGSALLGVLPLLEHWAVVLSTSDDLSDVITLASEAQAAASTPRVLAVVPFVKWSSPSITKLLEHGVVAVALADAFKLEAEGFVPTLVDFQVRYQRRDVDPPRWLLRQSSLVLDPARYRGWLGGVAFDYRGPRLAGRMLCALAAKPNEYVLNDELASGVWGQVRGVGGTTPNLADQKRELVELLAATGQPVPIENLPAGAPYYAGGYRLTLPSVVWMSTVPDDQLPIPSRTQRKKAPRKGKTAK